MAAFTLEPLIEPRKLQEYLLSLNHQSGGSKAQYLASAGYTRRNWMRLRSDLLEAVEAAMPATGVQGTHGIKFTVLLAFNGPSGRAVRLTTIWIADASEPRPRLVTAFPRRMP